MRKQKRLKYGAYCVIKFPGFNVLGRRCRNGDTILISSKVTE